MFIYSRNQENHTDKYPDVIERMPSCLVDTNVEFIADGEVVAWDLVNKIILPFQSLSTRKRKVTVYLFAVNHQSIQVDNKTGNIEIKVAVSVFLFDLLYLNGESLVGRTFRERRDLLKKTFKPVEDTLSFANSIDTVDTEEINVGVC